MRNRAKCRLCETIIESHHRYDSVSCKCGEITIDGGNDYMHASFKNRDNFICVDDEGNEIVPKYENDEDYRNEKFDKGREILKEQYEEVKASYVPTREDLLREIEAMIRNIEELPMDALYAPVTNADFGSLLVLLKAILKSS